jgi:hypothetical protein
VDQELQRRGVAAMIARFEAAYPGGFHGEAYLQRQRRHKERASMIGRDRLAPAALRELVGRHDWERLFDRIKLVVEMTDLIPVGYWRTRLLDEIRKPTVARLFYPALFDALHGTGTAAERLGRFAAALHNLGLRQWSYPSYFLFLCEPAACMFVMRERLDAGVDMARYPLDIPPFPGAEPYADILTFSRWLKDTLQALEPRDMLDVQSFIWHVTAPA